KSKRRHPPGAGSIESCQKCPVGTAIYADEQETTEGTEAWERAKNGFCCGTQFSPKGEFTRRSSREGKCHPSFRFLRFLLFSTEYLRLQAAEPPLVRLPLSAAPLICVHLSP